MEEIVPGLTLEWLFDRRVVSYTLYSPKRSALMAWSEIALSTLETWPREKPYLAIHDISRSGVGLFYCASVKNDVFNFGVIPEARTRVDSVVDANPAWQLSLALVVSDSLSGHLSKVLFKDDSSNPCLDTKAFFFRDAAQRWLLSAAPTPNNSKEMIAPLTS